MQCDLLKYYTEFKLCEKSSYLYFMALEDTNFVITRSEL
jgi:hypothetical protein